MCVRQLAVAESGPSKASPALLPASLSPRPGVGGAGGNEGCGWVVMLQEEADRGCIRRMHT